MTLEETVGRALSKGVSLSPEGVAAIGRLAAAEASRRKRRRLLEWSLPTLLAATLACAAAFHAVFAPRESRLEDVILVLAALDDLPVVPKENPVELLLAWQEPGFEDVAN